MYDLMLAYFERFGGKPVCLTDLKLYTKWIDNIGNQRSFIKRCRQFIPMDSHGVPTTVSKIQEINKRERRLLNFVPARSRGWYATFAC